MQCVQHWQQQQQQQQQEECGHSSLNHEGQMQSASVASLSYSLQMMIMLLQLMMMRCACNVQRATCNWHFRRETSNASSVASVDAGTTTPRCKRQFGSGGSYTTMQRVCVCVCEWSVCVCCMNRIQEEINFSFKIGKKNSNLRREYEYIWHILYRYSIL